MIGLIYEQHTLQIWKETEVRRIFYGFFHNMVRKRTMSRSPVENELIGSPTRGLYVPQQKVEKLPKSTPKLFALKLFELVFSREEAKMGSVEGKVNKLCKLDPKRLAAVNEHTERMFPADNLKWAEIKKAIDEKCRMVRNNRCLLWAGVNMST